MSANNLKKVLPIFAVLLLLPNVTWANSGDMWKIVVYPVASAIIEAVLSIVNIVLLVKYIKVKKAYRREIEKVQKQTLTVVSENTGNGENEKQQPLSASSDPLVRFEIFIIFTIVHMIVFLSFGHYAFMLFEFLWKGIVYAFGLIFLGKH